MRGSFLFTITFCSEWPFSVAITKLLDTQTNSVAWAQKIRSWIAPAQAKLQFLLEKHKDAVRIAEAAELLLPWRFRMLNPSCSKIKEELRFIPRISNAIQDQCLLQRDAYYVASEGVQEEIDVSEFWKIHQNKLSAWAAVFEIVGLLQPSSASAERAFSLWQSVFENVSDSNEDYLDASLLCRMNTS